MSVDRIRQSLIGFESIEDTLNDCASFRVRFDRDESDSFSLEVNQLRDLPPGVTSPSRADLLPLLPSGSRWSPVLGWRSFIGVPCRINDGLWLAFGEIKILEHESRGAYPLATIYLMDLEEVPVSSVIDELVAGLLPGREVSEPTSPAHGAVIGNSDDPSEHVGIEARILLRAKKAYNSGKKLMFRTAILSEEEIPSPSVFGVFGRNSRSPIVSRYVLYGIIPPVYDTFSWSSKLKVFLERNLTAALLAG